MPIKITPLPRRSLTDQLDKSGLTLDIRETGSDGWVCFFLSLEENEDEYDLYDEWGVVNGDTPQEALENLCAAMSDCDLELGDYSFENDGFKLVAGEV